MISIVRPSISERVGSLRLYALILLILLESVCPLQADTAATPDTLPAAKAKLAQLQEKFAKIQNSPATAQELKKLKREIATIRSAAQDCIRDAEPQLDYLNNELNALQPQLNHYVQSFSASRRLIFLLFSQATLQKIKINSFGAY